MFTITIRVLCQDNPNCIHAYITIRVLCQDNPNCIHVYNHDTCTLLGQPKLYACLQSRYVYFVRTTQTVYMFTITIRVLCQDNPNCIHVYNHDTFTLLGQPKLYTCLQSRYVYFVRITQTVYMFTITIRVLCQDNPNCIHVYNHDTCTLLGQPKLYTCLQSRYVLCQDNPNCIHVYNHDTCTLLGQPKLYTCLQSRYVYFVRTTQTVCMFTITICVLCQDNPNCIHVYNHDTCTLLGQPKLYTCLQSRYVYCVRTTQTVYMFTITIRVLCQDNPNCIHVYNHDTCTLLGQPKLYTCLQSRYVYFVRTTQNMYTCVLCQDNPKYMFTITIRVLCQDNPNCIHVYNHDTCTLLGQPKLYTCLQSRYMCTLLGQPKLYTCLQSRYVYFVRTTQTVYMFTITIRVLYMLGQPKLYTCLQSRYVYFVRTTQTVYMFTITIRVLCRTTQTVYMFTITIRVLCQDNPNCIHVYNHDTCTLLGQPKLYTCLQSRYVYFVRTTQTVYMFTITIRVLCQDNPNCIHVYNHDTCTLLGQPKLYTCLQSRYVYFVRITQTVYMFTITIRVLCQDNPNCIHVYNHDTCTLLGQPKLYTCLQSRYVYFVRTTQTVYMFTITIRVLCQDNPNCIHVYNHDMCTLLGQPKLYTCLQSRYVYFVRTTQTVYMFTITIRVLCQDNPNCIHVYNHDTCTLLGQPKLYTCLQSRYVYFVRTTQTVYMFTITIRVLCQDNPNCIHVYNHDTCTLLGQPKLYTCLQSRYVYFVRTTQTVYMFTITIRVL